MHIVQHNTPQERLLSGLSQKLEQLKCDPSIPVKFGILGNYGQADFINQLQATLQNLPESDLAKRIATIFNDYVAVIFFPEKTLCTEIWVFESFHLATQHIKLARSALAEADSLEKLRHALDCLKEAFKIQKFVHGNLIELKKAILDISKKVFFKQNQSYQDDYLSTPEEIARFHEAIVSVQMREDIFEALLSLVDNTPDESRSAASYLIQAISHEFSMQPLAAAEGFAILFEQNRHHPQTALNCLKKAASYFDAKSHFNTLDYPNFLEKLNRSALMEVLETTQDNYVHGLLNAKDAIRMAFNQLLGTLSRQSLLAPSCFICFDQEKTEIAKWIGQILIGDLEMANIIPISNLRNLSFVDDSDFHKQIRESDHVIVICTPSLKKKCDQDEEAQQGVAQEIRLSQERRLTPTQNKGISILYMEGDRSSACPSSLSEPTFAGQYNPLYFLGSGSVFNYYNIAFELIGAIKHISYQAVQQIKSQFIQEVGRILRPATDQKVLEEWRLTPVKRTIEISTSVEIQAAHRKFSLTETDQLQEVIIQLRSHYTSKKHIVLLTSQDEKKIPIEQLYIRLAIMGEHKKKVREKEQYESIFDPKEAIKLEELFELETLNGKNQKRVLIQGSAGIGKSTLCQYIAFMWAEGKLYTEFEYLFWLPLRNLNIDNYQNERSLEAYLAKECQVDPEYIRSFLRHKKLREKTLILLDGYNELSPDAVNATGPLNPILRELKKFPNVVVVTRPRSIDFNPDCNLEILGFDEVGVEDYIGRFFSEEQNKQAHMVRQELKNPLIRSLARIPINLEIICSLIAAGGRLSASTETTSMTTLYRQLTNGLYKRFGVEQSLRLTNPTEVFDEYNMLYIEEMAWQAMEQNALYFPAPQSIKIMIEELSRMGLLKIEGSECVFVHLTFQEFFAAAKLARMYVTNPLEAKEYLKKIKFDPRYLQVLRMVAGHLSLNQPDVSKQTKTYLQLFFDDLFSKPHDLAISYGLRTHATCFEECEKPEDLSQYKSFIEQIVKFLNTCPGQQLILKLLTSHSKLVGQKEIISVLRNHLQHAKKRLETLVILRHLAENDLVFPPEILTALNTCLASLSNHKEDLHAKAEVIRTWKAIAQNGQVFPSEMFQPLIACISDSKANYFAQSGASEVLRITAKSGQASTFNALTALITLVKDSKSNLRYVAATAIGAVARSGQALPYEAFAALIACLLDPTSDEYAKFRAVGALGAVVRSGQTLPPEAFQALIASLFDPEIDVNAKFKVAKVLRTIVRDNQTSSAEALAALIACLTDSKVDISAKFAVAEILLEMSKSGQALPSKVFQAIMTSISDPDADGEAVSFIAEKLRTMAESGLPSEALQALGASLCGPKENHEIYIAAEVLVEMANRGQVLPPDCLQAFIAFLSDSDVNVSRDLKSHAAQALGALARNGHKLPIEARPGLIATLLDHEVDFDGKFGAVVALETMDEGNQALLPKVLPELTGLLSDPKVESAVKIGTLKALKAMASSGPAVLHEAFRTLVACLSDPTMPYDVKSETAKAFGTIAWSGQALPTEAFAALIACLHDPKANQSLKFSVGHALIAVAKNGQAYPSETFQGLIACTSNPALDYNAKTHAAEALAAAAQSSQALPSEALVALSACLSNPKVDSKSKQLVFEGLQARIQTGIALPPEAFQIIITSLFSDFVGSNGKPIPSMYNAKFLGAMVLGEVARSELELPTEAFQALIACLFHPKNTDYTKSQAIQGLGAMVKRGRILPPEAFPGFIACLSGCEIGSDATFRAAEALGVVVRSGQVLPPEALSGLITCLSNPTVNDDAKSQAAKVLGLVAKNNQAMFLERLGEIIQTLETTSDRDTKNSILDFLDAIVKSQNYELNYNNYKLLAKLFFLTGYSLFYRDEIFYATISTNNELKIPINQEVDARELYQKLVMESVKI